MMIECGIMSNRSIGVRAHELAAAADQDLVPQEGSEAHARGLPLLGAIRAAFLPEQGVLAAPAPRLQRASKHLRRPPLVAGKVG